MDCNSRSIDYPQTMPRQYVLTRRRGALSLLQNHCFPLCLWGGTVAPVRISSPFRRCIYQYVLYRMPKLLYEIRLPCQLTAYHTMTTFLCHHYVRMFVVFGTLCRGRGTTMCASHVLSSIFNCHCHQPISRCHPQNISSQPWTILCNSSTLCCLLPRWML